MGEERIRKPVDVHYLPNRTTITHDGRGNNIKAHLKKKIDGKREKKGIDEIVDHVESLPGDLKITWRI